jgi:hypothetical protein
VHGDDRRVRVPVYLDGEVVVLDRCRIGWRHPAPPNTSDGRSLAHGQ